MTKLETISKLESKLRPILVNLPSPFITSLYSNQKKKILKRLSEDYLNFDLNIVEFAPLKLWDINFAFPLFNSAGMFKKGESYYTVAKQGAGAYLSGTTTSKYRKGNFKNGVLHPFAPFPNSGSAVNWMGLPNEGHSIVAKRLSLIEKFPNCPIGASLSSSPEESEIEALENIVIGMDLYEKANVDFLEINESCPNVAEGHSVNNSSLDIGLVERLEYISKHFLKKRQRNIPVIVKFSNDTNLDLVSEIIDILINLGFDGVNFGNTSTQYNNLSSKIEQKEKKIYHYFTENFGGGLSGSILKSLSLKLVETASDYLKTKNTKGEFLIIRTGGVDSPKELDLSLKSGAAICQWYTAYFSDFAKYGHNIYNKYKTELKKF